MLTLRVCDAAVLFGPSRAAGQTWTSVGSTGALAYDVSLAFNNGELYIAFADYYYYYYYSVKPAFVAQRDVRSWHAPGKFEKMVK